MNAGLAVQCRMANLMRYDDLLNYVRKITVHGDGLYSFILKEETLNGIRLVSELLRQQNDAHFLAQTKRVLLAVSPIDCFNRLTNFSVRQCLILL